MLCLTARIFGGGLWWLRRPARAAAWRLAAKRLQPNCPAVRPGRPSRVSLFGGRGRLCRRVASATMSVGVTVSIFTPETQINAMRASSRALTAPYPFAAIDITAGDRLPDAMVIKVDRRNRRSARHRSARKDPRTARASRSLRRSGRCRSPPIGLWPTSAM
jgi:hypothetical protein